MKLGLTWQAWTATNNPTIIGNTQVGGWAIAIGNANTTLNGNIYRNGAYATITVALTSLTAGWHHFAITYDGQLTKMYVDGALAGTNNAGAVFPITYNATNSTLMGAEVGTGAIPAGNYWMGSIDE